MKSKRHGRTQDIEFNDYDHMEALADIGNTSDPGFRILIK